MFQEAAVHSSLYFHFSPVEEQVFCLRGLSQPAAPLLSQCFISCDGLFLVIVVSFSFLLNYAFIKFNKSCVFSTSESVSCLVTSSNLCCCCYTFPGGEIHQGAMLQHLIPPRFPHATHEKQTKMFHTIHQAVCTGALTFPLKPAVSSSHDQNLNKINVFTDRPRYVLLLGDNHCDSSIVMLWFMWMTLLSIRPRPQCLHLLTAELPKNKKYFCEAVRCRAVSLYGSFDRMHPIILLFVISLLHSYEARGSDTGTPVFVQKGKDLILHVTAPVKLVERDIFAWKFKDSNIFRLFDDNKAIITDPYVGRVEIFRQNHSLLLKNVQQNDSGSYIAVVVGKNNNDAGKYSVTVQDPVSLVNGTVDLHSSSSDSCNLTVTCSTQDSHHIISTFRCEANTCSQEEGGERSKVTTSGSSLRVFLSKSFLVICNHSNQVSSDEHTTMIRDFCFKHPAPEPQSNIIAFVNMTVIKVLVIIAMSAAFVGYRIKGKHESEDMKKTVYENVQVIE
ncbi:uncharacterized protein LOC133968457 isoform X2 [Platichthys flesus]|uniref:uncharacterized protein LOC133968457 isoform X2 n=1 Tax=Platichthys flesus TaxID=8260 RepID=UPI002DB8E2FE|nr:uncharacterized protein LOC133968457 isoform X2 [Platichthys flesus]